MMTKRPLVTIDKISKGADLVAQKSSPDSQDSLEENSGEVARLQAELADRNEGVEDRKANRKLRSEYAKKVYQYLIYYSGACMLLLVLSGFKVLDFHLPDIVLTVVVGSTAAAAIGLVGFVVNGLFKG